MKIKEFLKNNIAEIFWGMTIAFLVFAIAFAFFVDTKNNTNNYIKSYAVEEEEENVVNLPFDFTANSYSPTISSFPTYSSVDATHSYTITNIEFGICPTVFFDTVNNIYNISFNDAYNDISNNRIKIYPVNFSNYLTNFTFNINNLFNLKDYCVLTSESVYIMNLNNLEFLNIVLCYYNSNILQPFMFIEGLDNIDGELTSEIIYDTTYTYTGGTLTYDLLVNKVDYKKFQISTNTMDRNGFYSINGKNYYRPTKSIRRFTLNPQFKYQEGYNAGYEEGYNNAMEEMQNANIQNPFKDRWIVNAYANRNNNTIVPMNNSDYTDVYGYIDNCIYNNLPVGAWANDVNQQYNNISNYNLSFWANNVKEYFIDLSVNQILNIAQVFVVDDKAEYINEIRYNVSVKLSLLNAGNNQTQVITLNYLANDIINIDFTNINGDDYTYNYLKGVELQFSDYSYLSNKYCIRFNNYGNGNYSQGYYNGFRDGSAGADKGYLNGYNRGYADASGNSQYTFFSLIGAVIDAPIRYFTSLFDYKILGTNIKGFLLALLTIGIALAVVRISLAKK